MKSIRPVMDLEEIVKPYVFTPPVNIEMGINGEMLHLQKDIPHNLTYAQFEVILFSEYGKYL